MGKARVIVASLTLSAAALIGIVVEEGYTERATIPTKNDRPTLGYGSTFHADGTPVKLGDKTDPVRALITLQAHVSKEEERLRACIGDTPLHQYEYDAVVSWAYNVGSGAACSSTLMRKLRARDYSGACDELLKWRFASGRELRGLAIRRAEERRLCLGLSASGNNAKRGQQ